MDLALETAALIIFLVSVAVLPDLMSSGESLRYKIERIALQANPEFLYGLANSKILRLNPLDTRGVDEVIFFDRFVFFSFSC